MAAAGPVACIVVAVRAVRLSLPAESADHLPRKGTPPVRHILRIAALTGAPAAAGSMVAAVPAYLRIYAPTRRSFRAYVSATPAFAAGLSGPISR